MKLGIDIDDVLAAFIPRFRLHAKALYPDWEKLDEEPTDWSWANWMLSKEEMGKVWARVAEIPRFHESLNPLPDTSLLATLAYENDVYFITARFATSDNVSAKRQSENWLTHHFGIYVPTVLLARDKVPIINGLELDAFIDDKAETCNDAALQCSPRTKVTLMSRRHNEAVDFPDRVDTFNEWARRFL